MLGESSAQSPDRERGQPVRVHPVRWSKGTGCHCHSLKALGQGQGLRRRAQPCAEGPFPPRRGLSPQAVGNVFTVGLGGRRVGPWSPEEPGGIPEADAQRVCIGLALSPWRPKPVGSQVGSCLPLESMEPLCPFPTHPALCISAVWLFPVTSSYNKMVT